MSRYPFLRGACTGKDVLDIGSTGQTDAYDLWNELKTIARTLVGIDVVPSDDPMIVTGDMETYRFDRKFDVIIAGDVLEHVMNQGEFLKNCLRFLNPNGRLVITTPNAKWFTVVFQPNPTHTLWHDRHTVQYVLKQAGFVVERMGYYLGNKHRYPWWLYPFVWRQGMLIVARPAV